MEGVDVLVVGSGPAGSTTARFAAEDGASVLFIERRSRVGVPVRCGEFMPGISEIRSMFPGLEDAEPLFDVPESLQCRHVDGIKLVDPQDRVTLLDFDGYTTDRDRFDRHLADLAVEAGAVLETGCSFESYAGGVASTSQGDIRCKVIVGADGPGSRVARCLGLERNRNPYPAVTAEVEGDFEPYTYMFFGDIAPGAYSWIIPKDGRANVGVGFSPKFAEGNVREYFEGFARKRGFAEHSRVVGKYVPSEGPIPSTATADGMVVGDAAGQVISVNGGGIPLAMIAGRAAGRAAAANVSGGSPLSRYEEEWRRVMDKPLRTAALNKRLADTFAFRSESSTAMCMNFLGARRMGNLIRCKRIFPRSLSPARLHRGAAHRALVGLLLEPLPAPDAPVVPLGDLGYAGGAHRAELQAQDPGDVLYRVVVREDRPADVEGERQHRPVHRGEPSGVPGAGGRLLHPLQGLPGAVGHLEHAPPQVQAGVVVALELGDHARGADVVLVGRRVHREQGGGVQHEHATTCPTAVKHMAPGLEPGSAQVYTWNLRFGAVIMDAVDVIVIMLNGLWLFLPAMLPNSAAVVFGGETKMDFGKSWRGKRIFGDGKSWRGFFGGAFSGVVLGLILIGVAALFGSDDNYWGFGPFWSNVGVLLCLSFGAVLGDLCAAFIKRRMGLARGAKAPILDQYDFVIGAFLVTALFFPDWVYANFIEGWHLAALILIIVLMFAIHRGANIIGYRMGLKKEPW